MNRINKEGKTPSEITSFRKALMNLAECDAILRTFRSKNLAFIFRND